jgi:membrane-associated protein
MNIIQSIVDVALHLDKYLGAIVQTYGAWAYGMIFFVIFLETGFVFTPFLPGDSLIFAAGTMAGAGYFNIWLLFGLLALAAILGDTVNYWVGYYVGNKIFDKGWIKGRYRDQTKDFFKKYGTETIIIARFIPIVRTFAPLMAGIGKMRYWKFFAYNVVGGVLWTGLFVWGGYFFGNLKWVQDHFTLVIILIICTSLIPPIWHFIKNQLDNWRKK